jgi:8-oxo-dGTP pyrophosphatase MutT (NUDIX family)
VREVREEVGIQVEAERPIGTFHFYRGTDKIEHLGVSFLCRYVSGEVQVDGIEQISHKWASFQEASALITDPSILKSLGTIRSLIT